LSKSLFENRFSEFIKLIVSDKYLKVYKDYNENKLVSDKPQTYIVKISGIWENSEDVGITYKVFESSPAI
jgi:hypothetical protein